MLARRTFAALTVLTTAALTWSLITAADVREKITMACADQFCAPDVASGILDAMTAGTLTSAALVAFSAMFYVVAAQFTADATPDTSSADSLTTMSDGPPRRTEQDAA